MKVTVSKPMGEMKMLTVGQKVTLRGSQAEVVRINKNGTVRVGFWVHGFGMVAPEWWEETVKPKHLKFA